MFKDNDSIVSQVFEKGVNTVVIPGIYFGSVIGLMNGSFNGMLESFNNAAASEVFNTTLQAAGIGFGTGYAIGGVASALLAVAMNPSDMYESVSPNIAGEYDGTYFTGVDMGVSSAAILLCAAICIEGIQDVSFQDADMNSQNSYVVEN